MSGRVNVTDFNQKLNAMITINLKMMKDDCNMLRIVNVFLPYSFFFFILIQSVTAKCQAFVMNWC